MWLEKRVRWATAARDRAALAERLGPPVQADFKDLEVDWQAGHRCEGRVASERVTGAAERLRRCGSLAVGVHGELRVAGGGIGQRAWMPRRVVVARSGARQVVARYTFRMAVALREGVGAWAVLAP